MLASGRRMIHAKFMFGLGCFCSPSRATLIVVCWYAWDTDKMKREMLSQGTASRRPFLNVNNSQPNEPFGAAQLLCNVGEGIAYKVSWKFDHDNPHFLNIGGYLGSMSVGMKVPLAHYDGTSLQTHMLREFPVRIDYEDSAGKRYRKKE
jgi:hypothetical protein